MMGEFEDEPTRSDGQEEGLTGFAILVIVAVVILFGLFLLSRVLTTGGL